MIELGIIAGETGREDVECFHYFLMFFHYQSRVRVSYTIILSRSKSSRTLYRYSIVISLKLGVCRVATDQL